MSETMDLLIGDLEALAENWSPPRDGVLQLVMEVHVEHFGPGVPVDLEWMNNLLAKYGQPLATETEISVWYGDPLPAHMRN